MTANGLRVRIGVLALLVAVAVVVVVLVSGGGAARPGRSASNRTRATREADRLLAGVALPTGATVPAAAQNVVSRLGRAVAVDVVQRTRRFTVPVSSAHVRAYLLAHPPAGTVRSGTGLSFIAHQLPRGVASAVVGVVLGSITPTRTSVLVTVQARWLVGRAASELLPADVHEVDITRGRPGATPSLVLHVTPPQLTAIVTRFDRLPTVQPGVTYHCPQIVSGLAVVTFTFRSRRGGAVLARAAQQADVVAPTTACDAMSVAVAGHRGTPLLGGATFLRQVSRIVGYRLWTPPYAA